MKKSSRLALGLTAALVAGVGLGSTASATTYFFHFQGDPANTTYGDVLINGHFTLAGNAPGPIMSVTGTVSGGNTANVVDGPITSLSPYAASDNILYAYGTFGDYSFGGVSFNVSETTNNVTETAAYNLYDWNGGTYLLVSTVDATGYPQFGTISAPPPPPGGTPPAQVGIVPEPATWALMLTGFGLLGGAMRTAGRRRTAAPI